MTPDEILKAFDNIRVWQRGDRRAPHKPLLILMALGSLARGEKPRAEFAEIEGKLGRLLEEFWPLGVIVSTRSDRKCPLMGNF